MQALERRSANRGAPSSSAADRWPTTCRRLRNAHPGRVRVLTGVAHDDVPEHLNAMDLLCAPSQTTTRWREQFGRMLIEAMACGVPVVASRSGEIPHVVGDAGLVVDEADVGRVDGRHRPAAGGRGAAPRPVGARPRACAREVRLARRRPRALAFFEELL